MRKPIIHVYGRMSMQETLDAMFGNATTVNAGFLNSALHRCKIAKIDNLPPELEERGTYQAAMHIVSSGQEYVVRYCSPNPAYTPGSTEPPFIYPTPELERHTPKSLALDEHCTCEYCGREYKLGDHDGDIEPFGYCPDDDCPSREFHAAASTLAAVLGNAYEALRAIKLGNRRYSQETFDTILSDAYHALKLTGSEISDFPKNAVATSHTGVYGVITAHEEWASGGNLMFTLSEHDKEELQALYELRGEDSVLIDLLEPLTCNGVIDFVRPEKIAALTDAPILTDMPDYEGGVANGGTIWWYPQYEVISPVLELINNGTVTFTRAR